MPESDRHIEYVTQAETFVREHLPQDVSAYLLVDSPSSREVPPPMQNGGYRPDLYLNHDQWHLIGEAKTDSDCMRPHSQDQYRAYLKELMSYHKMHSILVLSCSMVVSPSLSNYFRRLKKELVTDVSIVILNELGVYRRL